MKINELCNEITSLKQKIGDEPKNSAIRMLKLKAEIEELVSEKRHAGFRHDQSSVIQLNTGIKNFSQS